MKEKYRVAIFVIEAVLAIVIVVLVLVKVFVPNSFEKAKPTQTTQSSAEYTTTETVETTVEGTKTTSETTESTAATLVEADYVVTDEDVITLLSVCDSKSFQNAMGLNLSYDFKMSHVTQNEMNFVDAQVGTIILIAYNGVDFDDKNSYLYLVSVKAQDVYQVYSVVIQLVDNKIDTVKAELLV